MGFVLRVAFPTFSTFRSGLGEQGNAGLAKYGKRVWKGQSFTTQRRVSDGNRAIKTTFSKCPAAA
jgi:hypothetical protein